MKIIPQYHPPSDYRRPTKTQEKVYVPVNDYPEINFSMLLILPTYTLFCYCLSSSLLLMASKSHSNPVPTNTSLRFT